MPMEIPSTGFSAGRYLLMLAELVLSCAMRPLAVFVTQYALDVEIGDATFNNKTMIDVIPLYLSVLTV